MNHYYKKYNDINDSDSIMFGADVALGYVQ